MELNNIKFNGYTIEANAYDNTGAHNMLKSMMQRGDELTVRFFTDKWLFPCVWVESKQIKGFKYRLSELALQWISGYIFSGEFEDVEVNPTDIKQEKEGDEDFQEGILKFLLHEGISLQFTPLFRERSGYISAISSQRKGKIQFSIKRTEEMLDFLRENDVLI